MITIADLILVVKNNATRAKVSVKCYNYYFYTHCQKTQLRKLICSQAAFFFIKHLMGLVLSEQILESNVLENEV